MICLETDFLVDVLRQQPLALQKLEELTAANKVLAVTPLTITELFLGAFKSKKQENIALVERLASH